MRATQFISEELLSELAMNPNSLRRMAATVNAKVGMEFEMYVPNVNNKDDEQDLEPDMSQDTRSGSIDDVIEFFKYDGMNSGRLLEKMRNELDEEYMEYYDEQLSREWKNDKKEIISDYIENYDLWDKDEAITLAVEEMGLSDEEKNAVQEIASGKRKPVDNSERENWLGANRLAQEKLDDLVEEAIDEENDICDQAFEDFRDNFTGENDSDFLRDKYPYMSDILNSFNIEWPYITYPESSGESMDSVAVDFEQSIGRPVSTSSRYHGATRDEVSYIVEPDGSLDEPNSHNDSGLEFVSPPLPLNQMLSDLKKVRDWAGMRGCYTNSSTGLHINVSLEGMTAENVDFVKLALLIGDKHILDQFGRAMNTYASSALGYIESNVRNNPEKVEKTLQLMRGKMSQYASKLIHTGETSKFTSINNKGAYIEFRSPGDDWLDEYYDLIEPTVLRLVVALDAACDPQKSRKEYLKKLYTILAPTSDKDPLSYFARWSAGELPFTALKSFVKNNRNTQKMKKEQPPVSQPASSTQQWKFKLANGSAGTVNGSDYQDALQNILINYGANSSNIEDLVRIGGSPAGIPSAQATAQQTGLSQWTLVDRNTGQHVGTPFSAPAGSVFRSESEDRVFSRSPTISIECVKQVHVLLKEKAEYRSAQVRGILIQCKQLGLPVYLYTDESSWRLQNINRAVQPSAVLNILRGQYPKGYSGEPYQSIEPWLELIMKNKKTDLSPKGEKLRYNLVYYGYRNPQDDNNVVTDFANSRKPDSGGYDMANRITEYMRKNKIPDLLTLKNILAKKWHDISEAEYASK